MLLNCLVVDRLRKILRIRIGNAHAKREQANERKSDSRGDKRPERALALRAFPLVGKSLASQAPA